jgi:hypothetical protein
MGQLHKEAIVMPDKKKRMQKGRETDRQTEKRKGMRSVMRR